MSAQPTSTEGVARSDPSIETFISALQSADPSDVRKLTHEWVTKRGDGEQQLEGIKDILELARRLTESLGEAASEARAMLLDERIFRYQYETKEDATATLDKALPRETPAISRNTNLRKDAYIKTIEKTWGESTNSWNLGQMGENHLRNIASVCQRLEFSEAVVFVQLLTLDRLSKAQSGRGGTKEVIPKDWGSLKDLDDGELEALRSRPTITPSERAKYSTILPFPEIKSSTGSESDSKDNDGAECVDEGGDTQIGETDGEEGTDNEDGTDNDNEDSDSTGSGSK